MTTMLLAVVDDDKKEELEVFLSRFGVLGFTEISRALGAGLGGPRLGSRAFPDTSAVVFTILDETELEKVRAAIGTLCDECGDSLHMVAWDVDRLA